MSSGHTIRNRNRIVWTCAVVLCLVWQPPRAAGGANAELLDRTSQQVTKFLDEFSDVKYTEQVTQEKLDKNGKVEVQERSAYDYLVILTNTGGELRLDE